VTVIANSGISDVREVLDYYNKEIDPLDAFKLNQARVAVIFKCAYYHIVPTIWEVTSYIYLLKSILKESELERKKEAEALSQKQKASKSGFSFFRR
jgi:hypothetical protein